MNTLLINLAAATRNYLKVNKGLNDQQIDRLVTARSHSKLSFWQSLTSDTGVNRGIKTLLTIKAWEEKAHEGSNLQQIVFNYLQNNMGSSNYLRNSLASELGTALQLNVQAISNDYDSYARNAVMITDIIHPYHTWIEKHIQARLNEIGRPHELAAISTPKPLRAGG